ncbi:SAM-dependent methyltransferase [Brevirhabdus pacifica]|uniref:SAM-dependent methyltransferase n=2 Tax=Brevirhabdus pacifica TaxID=1267768 RepID=A0A1U7DET9_9RHOB|nr:class I SAM-dependent rRNA methyltransferase [Brevirhabdus pacifica]APX88476.1 SAM-dependent methyltransferase [Brevirhabdus pacifica]OWU79779.1 SAM-dependent methyltransferase [Loktanella sp. 22II-4b]PJJ87051.1 SAM-dependent methyltransferase [Brevirhabdus pacifica]
MTLSPYPVVKLKPKADARAIRHGAPWVFSDELVLDRRTRALEPGTIAVLADGERQEMALVAITPASRITCRILDRDPAARIDAEWLRRRIATAMAMREHLYDAPFYRLVHAEADGLPGMVIDRFGDTAVVQPNAAWADRLMPEITAVLQEMGIANIVRNGSGRTRSLEGLEEFIRVEAGAVEGPVPVPMNGATYMADLLGGQKTGLFYDQRPNHAFAARLGRGGSVLDVFSHVGGFALAALAQGATEALAVDGSAPALELAEQGARESGLADRFTTRKGDAFDEMTALAEEGRKFDLVVCDPPAFAPGKKSLEAGLRAYERVARLAAGLVAPGGYLVLCSCSHAADLARFRQASTRGIGRGGRLGQLIHTGFAGPDHPMHPQLAESGYLKALFYRLDG